MVNLRLCFNKITLAMENIGKDKKRIDQFIDLIQCKNEQICFLITQKWIINMNPKLE